MTEIFTSIPSAHIAHALVPFTAIHTCNMWQQIEDTPSTSIYSQQIRRYDLNRGGPVRMSTAGCTAANLDLPAEADLGCCLRTLAETLAVSCISKAAFTFPLSNPTFALAALTRYMTWTDWFEELWHCAFQPSFL